MKPLYFSVFLLFVIFSCSSPEPVNTDKDKDTISNAIDNCVDIANQDQLDTDKDGIGDACDDDDDDDGILDIIDNCPLTANPNQEDEDTDGVGDVCDGLNDRDKDGIDSATDNCPDVANPNQEDTDNDGVGDACDTDDDDDGVLDVDDNCPLTANPNQEDANNNGIGDVCDDPNDSDSDGIANDIDNCPNIANPDQKDSDFDGIGDVCDDTVDKTPCVNGFAGEYPCNGYDLMANIPVSTLASSAGNNPEGSDIWGWVDPATNKEYALVATTNSTAFVDVTDPLAPVFLGRLDSNAGSNFWRDVKVYNNHAFIVADNVGSHGMQVFDLRKLRNVSNAPANFTADAVYTGVGSCHNIVINEDKGIAYLVGCRSTNGGGPIFIDISNPTNPTFLGDHTADGYSHDAQVVTYTGPDTEHLNKEIYIGSNTNQVVILDVTDKTNVKRLSTVTYAQIGYTHQGWFTEDQRYFILGDETDETGFGMNTRTLVFDLTDLDTPVLSSRYLGPTAAIDHNGYVLGNTYYLANYRAGVRFLDITNISNSTNSMTEIGYFDTYPANDAAQFNGTWSVYPYFPSGNIIISDIERGLFIIRKTGT